MHTRFRSLVTTETRQVQALPRARITAPHTVQIKEKIMSHAVIVQSAPSAGVIRQTALVPFNGAVRTFTRLGSGNRGSSGAWSETNPVAVADQERLIGEPASVVITENDARDLDVFEAVPSVLLQKLVRRAVQFSAINTDPTKTLLNVLNDLRQDALSNPSAFAIFTNSKPQVLVQTPTVQVVSTPVAPVAPSVPSAPVAPVASVDVLQFVTPTLQDPEVAVYIPRSDVYGKTEVEVFDFARDRQRVVALDGHAGTGKTSSARHYSALRSLPFLRVETHQSLSTAETQGKFVPDGHGGLRWVYSPLARAIQEPSVILLNEFTRTSQKNATLFLGLLEERQLVIDSHQGEIIKVHPECLFVVDYNSGYRGTVQLDQALIDRFGIKVKFTWSEEAERVRIPSASLREFAHALRKGAELEDKFSTPITTRLLLNFVEQAQGLSLQFAIESFLNAFPAEEQDAIKLLLAVYSNNIATELSVSLDGVNL